MHQPGPNVPADQWRQLQARALGDPTRHAILRTVVDAGGPVGVAQLTERFGLNHNAVRQHLARLCRAGLLVEETAPPQGRGRPRLRYRLAPEAAGWWETPGPYRHLALLLLEMVRGHGSAREVGLAAGRRLGQQELDQEAGHGSDAGAIDRLVDEVARQGFRPRRGPLGEADGLSELVLEHCPFAEAASVAPDLVCELHRGLAEGLLEAMGGHLEVAGLVAGDPSQAGCRLRVRARPVPDEN